MAVKRTVLDFDVEKQIVLNLIISTEFCTRILPATRMEYFRAKSMQALIGWTTDHFNKYKQAPGNEINTYYGIEKEYLDDDIAEQISTVLHHLSDVSNTAVNNVEVLVDRARELFQKKHFELQLNKANHHLLKGELDKVQEALDNRFVTPTNISTCERWDDPSFLKRVIQGMLSSEDPDAAFFRYEGRLGDFIGNIGRWFVSFLAPAKRGKTIYMMETCITAVRRKMNTVVFSLEMPTDQLMGRCLQAITSERPNTEEHEVLQPIFDCVLNQADDCDKSERVGMGNITTVNEQNEEILLPYVTRPDWTPCTACRGTTDFQPSVWYTPVTKKYLDEHEYFNKVNAFMRLYGKYCRSFFFPSKSITVDQIDIELDRLEQAENFIADVVILDYGDLMRAKKGAGVKRFDLDEIWEDYRSLQQRRKILFVTASQTNRSSVDSRFVRGTDVAEDYSKIAKLDLGLGLCQTDIMKDAGMININKIAFRHGEFVESHTCTVLQELGHMQSNLDSEYQRK